MNTENKVVEFASEHQEFLWLCDQYRLLWEFLEEENLVDEAEIYLKIKNRNIDKEISKIITKNYGN